MPKLAGVPAEDDAAPVERVARIADVIGGAGDRNEKLRRLAPEVVDALHEQRLFRLLLPRAFGGDEVDLVTWFNTMEALGKLDGSTGWCVGQINGCSATATAIDPAIARKIWGDPRGALSWGPPVKSRAEEVEGGHRVTGEWTMSSGSRHATWIGLMALPVDASGAPLPLPPGATMRVFFTPASSVTFIENWNVIGLIATNSGGFKGENIFVPHGRSIHLPYPRSLQPAGPLYKFPLNNLYGIGFAAVALGIARTMLDEVIALAREKKPWLARQPLQQSQLAQFQIGEAEARLRSARAYMESTAARVWESVVTTGELTIPQRVDIRMATTFAIHEAKTVADVAWDVAGATAIFLSNPFERRLRDLRTLTQQLQGRKSHLQDCGAYLLGLEPNLRHA
ncbi:MAG: acyl-CoA dehydrogenase [Hyphomicrobiales bacterium]|nr:acyl-CoA dehydrogenase [Hyphomicrobiales bacterium]MBV9427766.1 acyl-CoA dehydrogenase [Bradyrhizobiaceae bacterium]